MLSIHKNSPNTGKAAAAAVGAAVVACGVCCIPLVTPLALTLLARMAVYSANNVQRHPRVPPPAVARPPPMLEYTNAYSLQKK